MTTDLYREDLVVTVWTGHEPAVYSDEDMDEIRNPSVSRATALLGHTS